MGANQKWVIMIYVVGTLFFAVFLSRLIGVVFVWADVRDAMLLGSEFKLSDALAVVVSLIAAIGTYKNEQVVTLAGEVVTELRKVAWPTLKPWFSFKAEVWAGTYVVIITVVVVSLILGTFDMFWSWTTGYIYR